MIKTRLPKSFDLLLFWHGLFAGSYTIAYLTAEGAPALHQFAGYAAIGLLVLRLLMAIVVVERSPWALPWPKAAMWQAFGRKLGGGELSVFRGRTPLSPLSGLVLLATLVLVSLSGLAADWWKWEDLHGSIAEGSLIVVLVHVAIVSLGPLLKKLGERQSVAATRAGWPPIGGSGKACTEVPPSAR